MRNLLLGLGLGILLTFVPRAFTGQEPERISVGTTALQLGMGKDAVISKLAERGYKLTKVGAENSSDGWIVSEKNEQTGEYDTLGSITFKNGRLYWALRQWADSWDAGTSKVGKNLYFLIKTFEESGNTTCSIETKFQEGPEFESKKSLIHCGRRMIAIDVSRIREQHEETQVTETVQ